MDVRDYVAANATEFFGALKEWLAIPSVSADPGHHADVRRSAEWLAGHLRETGFPVAEVRETGGTPAVYAHWPAGGAGAPTALVYGHHDVQPAEPGDGWDSPLIEGEEESGSPYFADLLRERREELAADVIVVADTTMWAAGVPSMCTGMWGLCEAEITLAGPSRDVHSGSFGGGVPNPLHAMSALLAGLHDEHNRVTLPGFYDAVIPLTGDERELFARLPSDEKAWLADAGDSRAVFGEDGYSTLERIWARPTAEVNGMWGGHTGPGPKTIVSAAAHAKLSFRLVPEQDPGAVADALREYVASRTPPGIEATVTIGPAVRPCRSPITSPAVRAARRAMRRAFGREVLLTREGGSGPEADLAGILGAPLVFVAVGLDSDRIHAPNERVDMSLLLRGAEAAAYLWEELAAISADLS